MMGDEHLVVTNESVKATFWWITGMGNWITELLHTQSNPTRCPKLQSGVGDKYTLRAYL